jgi:hypothetical protein
MAVRIACDVSLLYQDLIAQRALTTEGLSRFSVLSSG